MYFGVTCLPFKMIESPTIMVDFPHTYLIVVWFCEKLLCTRANWFDVNERFGTYFIYGLQPDNAIVTAIIKPILVIFLPFRINALNLFFQLMFFNETINDIIAKSKSFGNCANFWLFLMFLNKVLDKIHD